MAETKQSKNKKEKELVTDINAISPELLAQITKQVSEQIMATLPKQESKTSKRKRSMQMDFDLEELVPVESIFHGTVECKSRTGKAIVWKDCGSTQYMTIGDVIDLNAFSDVYFNEPKLLVRDEEVAEYLNTLEINKVADKVANLDEFLKLELQDINDTLEELPKGLRMNIYSEIVRMIENNEINDLRLVRLLGKKLNIEFKIK